MAAREVHIINETGQLMAFKGVSQSQDALCPRCRHGDSLRLHAQLAEADGYPEVQCFECMACGEVVIVQRPISTFQADCGGPEPAWRQVPCRIL